MEAEELHIESCSVAYVPIIGYLLVIPENIAVPNNAMIQMVIFNFDFYNLKGLFG